MVNVRRHPVFYLRQAGIFRNKLLVEVDPDSLHDFRVCLRRIEVFLRLQKPLLGKTPYRYLIGRIKRLRKLTGPLREAHVSRRILKAARLPPGKKKPADPGLERKKERKLQAALGARTWNRFFSEVERALVDLGREAQQKKSRRKLNLSFLKEMGRVRKALQDYHFHGSSRRALHHLRIRSKRLRYGLEQFEFLDPPQRKKLLKSAHRVHDDLGRLLDLQTAEKGLGQEGARILSPREESLRRDAIQSIRRLEKVMG